MKQNWLKSYNNGFDLTVVSGLNEISIFAIFYAISDHNVAQE